MQEMAERCGLPKSTLESYMKPVPKRPGLEALLAIADGFDVSLDWLVGRSASAVSRRLTSNDYALASYNSVHYVLWDIIGEDDPDHLISKIAAKTMLKFRDIIAELDRTDARYGADRRDFSELIQAAANKHFTETSNS